MIIMNDIGIKNNQIVVFNGTFVSLFDEQKHSEIREELIEKGYKIREFEEFKKRYYDQWCEDWVQMSLETDVSDVCIIHSTSELEDFEESIGMRLPPLDRELIVENIENKGYGAIDTDGIRSLYIFKTMPFHLILKYEIERNKKIGLESI